VCFSPKTKIKGLISSTSCRSSVEEVLGPNARLIVAIKDA